MSKITSAEETLFQTLRIGSDIDWWRKEGIFTFSDVIKCINASKEQCRNATLEVAADKAKFKIIGQDSSYLTAKIDIDSILSLKDSKQLKIN